MNNYEENFEENWQELKNTIIKFLEGCLSISTVLTILFVILKTYNIINWSYLWILSPLWIPFAIIVGIFVLCAILVLITDIFESDE